MDPHLIAYRGTFQYTTLTQLITSLGPGQPVGQEYQWQYMSPKSGHLFWIHCYPDEEIPGDSRIHFWISHNRSALHEAEELRERLSVAGDEDT